MRQYYTCIFRSVLTSRIWAMSDHARLTWLWLQLMADPEGFVPTTLTGVALGVRIDLILARGAIAELSEPDPHPDPEDPYAGRLVERVEGGWRLIGFVEQREAAKYESKKAQMRKYMAKKRGANDGDAVAELAPAPDTLPATSPTGEIPTAAGSSPIPIPIPIPIPKQISSNEEIPAPAQLPLPFDAPVLQIQSKTITQIPPDYVLSAELIAAAKMEGVEQPEEWFAKLRLGPIGGARGIFEHELEPFIRTCFGKWRTWEQTNRAKAAAAAKAPAGRKPWAQPEEGARQTGWGKHLGHPHIAFAQKHGIDAQRLVPEFIRSGAIDQCATHADADKAFASYLKSLVKKGAA